MTETTTLATMAPAAELATDSVPILQSGSIDNIFRVSQAMCASNLIPAHLRGLNDQQGLANCLRVVNQAARWGLDPFAVADETYVVAGRLGYSGKLIAAVVQRVGKVKLRPVYNSAKGDERAVVVYGEKAPVSKEGKAALKKYAELDNAESLYFLEDMGILAVRLSVGQAKTKNDMWQKDPEQKLFYSACLKWARRHMPEFAFGIASDDDLEVKEVTNTWASQPAANVAPVNETAPPAVLATPAAEATIVPPAATGEPAGQTLQEALQPTQGAMDAAEPRQLMHGLPEDTKVAVTQLWEEFCFLSGMSHDDKEAAWAATLGHFGVKTSRELTMQQLTSMRNKLVAKVRDLYTARGASCPF